MNFCNNCGADLKNDQAAKFCFQCGNFLEKEFTQSEIVSSNKNNSNVLYKTYKVALLNLITSQLTGLKIVFRSSFKTKYSDFWSKEETELNKVIERLMLALKDSGNTKVQDAIQSVRAFLMMDVSGKSEKISEQNYRSFQTTSDGNKYRYLYTEFLSLIEKLNQDSVSQEPISIPISEIDENQISENTTDPLRHEFSDSYNSYGIIFTNLNRLANRLNCSEDEVKSVVSNYISQIEKCGHQYILFDAGNNSYNNITADDGWQSHVELLKDFHDDNAQAEYLFIIGGHDVVPMAIIDNKGEACRRDEFGKLVDEQIDTDMPYSYLMAKNFEDSLWEGNIFSSDVNLYCGRLPFPNDAELKDLKYYLGNSHNFISGNYRFTDLYGITAEVWLPASKEVINNLNNSKKLLTSPEITLNNLENCFNTNASLYFFNLHGSDWKETFVGESSDRKYYDAFSPDFIKKAENFHFLIAEACYGAKFIDLNSDDSILLSGIFQKTISFVGSSKIAFGRPGPSGMNHSADVVAKTYLENIVSGESSGRALAMARIEVYDINSPHTDLFDCGTTSAAEFNLFGDPICALNSNANKKSTSSASKRIRSKSFNISRPQKKEIKLDSNEKGILSDVRNLVNQEVLKIRDVINRELYAQFNIEPRHLSSVFEIKGKYGEKMYNYNYYKKHESGIKEIFLVFTDRTGKIKSIIQSK